MQHTTAVQRTRCAGNRAKPRAFTLIELLVVIAIIAILISIILPALAGARQQARVAATLARLRDLGMGVSMYSDANRGKNPVLLDREEKAFLGLSLLAREHAIPLQAFLNPNVRTDTAASEETTDGRPILADLNGVEISELTSISPTNLSAVAWHCSFAYDNDAKRGDDGRARAYLGDRADYVRGRTYSSNWGGQGQCVVFTDQHAVFLRTKSLREQGDPNMFHHNEFMGEGGNEVVNGIAVTKATLDTHLRFFSEIEDDALLPD